MAAAQAVSNVSLEEYLRAIESASSPTELQSISTQILGDSSSLSLVVARPLINALILKLSGQEQLLQEVLDSLTPRTSSFEEQVALVREALAACYEAQEDYLEAARVLQEIPLESSQRVINEEYKLKVLVRIIRCYLEEDETTSADIYLGRATNLIHLTSDPEILLHYKLAQARIFDAKRRFVDASQKYQELSYSTAIPEAERAACLEAAIVTAVLAPAGPTRSRILGTLYKDERSRSLQNHKMLEKMFLDRFIAKQELTEFAKTLKSHQLAQLGDGTTVLLRAVIEHNLVSASKIYENIGIIELGELLILEPRAAEKFARGMIESQRLQGEIDQVNGIITFLSPTKLAQEGVETERWDQGIASLLAEVESCASDIEKKYPEWVASRKQLTS